MKKYFLTIAMMLLVPVLFATVIQQEDFTPAQDGTLPATLTGEWDAGSDLAVIAYGTANPAVPADHAGGDGYVLRVGDLGAGGYNFVWPATPTNKTASEAEVKCYFALDSHTEERVYGITINSDIDADGTGVYTDRKGYFLFVGTKSTWSGYAPADKVAFLLKRSGGAWINLAEGTTVFSDGWHDMRIEYASDGTIRGFIDGTLEVSANDTDYASGFPVLLQYDGGADQDAAVSFDNFKWTEGEGTVIATPTPAPFGVIEPFNGPVVYNEWSAFYNEPVLGAVKASTQGIDDSPLGDGWIGKSYFNAPTYSTAGSVIGNDTDSDYTIQAYVYTPVVDTDQEPDDYWYQMLIFYRTGGGYARLHTQFNKNTTVIPNPRIRCQIANPGFVYEKVWEDPTGFTCPASSSWHKMKVVLSGTTAQCYFDDVELPGGADWTTEAASRNSGKFGFGQFIDGAGARSLYVDMFKAYKGSEPADPTPTPAPLAAENWMYYE
jgi:hypothetical protein